MYTVKVENKLAELNVLLIILYKAETTKEKRKTRNCVKMEMKYSL
jgi:hypothetical protein